MVFSLCAALTAALAVFASTSSTVAAAKIEPIYVDGALGSNFESWSWGISYLDFEDPCPGKQLPNRCLCAEVIPYGALSFKTTKPFPAHGQLHLHIHTNAPGLQLQLESSSEINYSISETVDITPSRNHNTKGHFFTKKIDLSTFQTTAPRFDRIVLGNCLENDASCMRGKGQETKICIESMFLDTTTSENTSHHTHKFGN